MITRVYINCLSNISDVDQLLDCLHSSNCITTVLREAQLLKIPVTISISCYLQYICSYTCTYSILLFSFHVIEKRSLLR